MSIPYNTFPSEHMRSGLKAWIERGRVGGGFLQAFVRGDLDDAYSRADAINRANLIGMVHWMVRHAPTDCWGSPEKAAQWAKGGGLAGHPDADRDHDLPRIYTFCNSCSPEWHGALALAEDGTCLAEHLCSNHGWIYHDLGVNEDGRNRDKYAEHYPDGFVVEFVENPKEHPGVQAAYKLNQEQPEEVEANE